ncbi:hypothetical protein SmJEL517_g01140 [Synchytrium microbalum]|uniref:Sugar transporter SWEET1 n=1 Tax=Synchytrium microbalum TaxID=1806994 RepID=A0A507CFH7_9FUNG|nr:uncharacterized protein SmJEL517_g01140 [Synchytrium microbalum]TPX36746.1 hypothetical protein SmJEL517_g01140 [Synchytrium microbalum]
MADQLCGDNHGCDVFLRYVIPSLGAITALSIFLAPMHSVLQVRNSQKLTVNPNPFPLLTGNCFGWALYGYLARDYFIMLPNMIGWSTSSFYLFTTYPLLQRKQQDTLVGLYIASQALLLFSGCFAFITLGATDTTGKTLVGIVTTAILVAFYFSPLSGLLQIIQSNDASSIHMPLALTSLCNGLLWGAYGLTIADYFVAVPNLFGFLTGCIQVILKVMLPSRSRRGSNASLHGQSDEES